MKPANIRARLATAATRAAWNVDFRHRPRSRYERATKTKILGKEIVGAFRVGEAAAIACLERYEIG